MSLSRSPSPNRDGGWSTPGLSTPAENTSRRPSPLNIPSNGQLAWKPKAIPRGMSTFPAKTSTFGSHLRKISASLPFWKPKNFSDKEKLGRGRTPLTPGEDWRRGDRILPFLGRLLWKLAVPISAFLVLILFIVFLISPVLHLWRGTGFLGGGSKYVIILATNLGGGVMEWKGPREWAIERDSIKNKKSYATRWGYHLEMADMSTKKRYAHEWRESWEKVDTIRAAMRKYPHAQWFWWLDLHTFIMEPSYSLQHHIFKNLQNNVYRDINVYNPLNISHPLTDPYLDPESLSAIGDGKPDSINLVVPQDCGGFNLGSFFIKRSPWTDRLLDIWWDPVGYEQKHMDWEHKEQDALEWMYSNQPWVRPHVAFIPQRRINSFPPGACSDKGLSDQIHYSARDRDFVVNMAGCEWGRDCWGEMHEYRKLSERLNRNVFHRIGDWIAETATGKKPVIKEDEIKIPPKKKDGKS